MLTEKVGFKLYIQYDFKFVFKKKKQEKEWKTSVD